MGDVISSHLDEGKREMITGNVGQFLVTLEQQQFTLHFTNITLSTLLKGEAILTSWLSTGFFFKLLK